MCVCVCVLCCVVLCVYRGSQMNPGDSFCADSSLRTFADSGLFTECVLLCFVFHLCVSARFCSYGIL